MNLIIDIETTGFSREKHSIVEIGWAITDPKFKIVHEDQIYIMAQDGKESSQEAIDVCGYDPALWEQRGAVSLEEAKELLKQKLNLDIRDPTSPPVVAWAHNAMSFDRPWVKHHFPFLDSTIGTWRDSIPVFRSYCESIGLRVVPSTKDPETGRVVIPGTLTLSGCTKLAEVPYTQAHGAIEDCRSLAACLAWLSERHRF